LVAGHESNDRVLPLRFLPDGILRQLQILHLLLYASQVPHLLRTQACRQIQASSLDFFPLEGCLFGYHLSD
jgi:hypothetical protein